MKKKPWIFSYRVAAVLLGVGVWSLTTASASAAPPGWSVRSEVDMTRMRVEGDLRVQVLNAENLVLTADYSKFIRRRFAADNAQFFINLAARNLPDSSWTHQVYTTALGAKAITDYRPQIFQALQDKSQFHLRESSSGKEIPLRDLGYWLNSTGQACFMEPGRPAEKAEIRTKSADVAHYVFLVPEEPLQENMHYRLEVPFQQNVEFDYAPETSESPIIKLNQLGYSPRAGQKYAYVGTWRGDLGAMPLKSWAGKPFYLRNSADHLIVFEGKLAFRLDDSIYASTHAPFSGEETLEMDFSSFSTPGSYQIYIPGIGNSYPFRIDESTLGEAFYLHARGLYHKRCGIAKEKPYTNWTSGACHLETYRGDFPPTDGDYGADASGVQTYGFTNCATGKKAQLKAFDIIASYKEENRPVIEGLKGGWHDAADYDRRKQHLGAVGDLLAAYLLAPENFTDGQLNLPESGNGIPDLVDEAVYGLEVWRRAQGASGGVGMWIECSHHPQESERDPAVGQPKYYLAAETRNGSAEYAGYAGMMALVMRDLKRPEEEALWTDSARRAWDFAENPANRYQHRFENITSGKDKISCDYSERPDLSTVALFKANFALYCLTGETRYLKNLQEQESSIIFALGDLSWKLSPFQFAEFQVYGQNYPEMQKIYRRYSDLVVRFANEMLDKIDNNYEYRVPWHSANHSFVTHMSWGTSHPLRNARYLVAAWKLTGKDKYRDGAFLANDFHNGANPLGVTMTSGLGKVYPVTFLDMPSYSDGIPEYVPGITPYRYTFRIPGDDAALAHGLYYSANKDCKFSGAALSLLPNRITNGRMDLPQKETYKLLGEVLPVWRRNTNIESYTVAVSEYTIWETISPAAAVTGILMTPGYLPDEAMKTRRSVSDITSLPGYAPLP